MGDEPSRGSVVPSYPPPSPIVAPPPPQPISVGLALVAAIAGFLGYCLAAAILALLSFIFGLWALFQLRAQIRAVQAWAKEVADGAVSRTRSGSTGTGPVTDKPGRPDEPRH
jgi:hypothetical protein